MASAPASAGYKREPGMTSSQVPAALREIGFDQNLDQPVPLDVTFRDEAGATVRLGDYFGKRPVVMVFAYYDCPMLCTQVINGLSSALGVLSLKPGQDFEIVTVSFNPADTPASASAKKAIYLERYPRDGAAASWHFLTGDQPSIDRLTKAAGFRYVWDAATKQFAHPSGIIVLTPDGRLARYLFGIEYGPRDLRYAIVEASDGKVGNVADVVDPTTRTVKIRCLVPNRDHRLKPEMFARVEVQGSSRHPVILVPAKAVLSDGDRWLVIVATEGNMFRSRRVAVGPELEGQVRIIDGLTPGEKIVSEGAIFMKREIESQ